MFIRNSHLQQSIYTRLYVCVFSQFPATTAIETIYFHFVLCGDYMVQPPPNVFLTEIIICFCRWFVFICIDYRTRGMVLTHRRFRASRFTVMFICHALLFCLVHYNSLLLTESPVFLPCKQHMSLCAEIPLKSNKIKHWSAWTAIIMIHWSAWTNIYNDYHVEGSAIHRPSWRAAYTDRTERCVCVCVCVCVSCE